MSARRFHPVDSRGRQTPQAAGEAVSGSESPAGSRIHNSSPLRRASLMQEPVLVLNATYEPINVTAVRRAMVLMLKGVAQAEELHSFRSAFVGEGAPGAVRYSAAGLPAYTAAEPGAFAEEYLVAGSEYLPVLRPDVSRIGTDAGPRRASFARRPVVVGESRRVLLQLQQQQGRPDARRSGFQIGTAAAAVHATHLAPAHAPDRPSRRAMA